MKIPQACACGTTRDGHKAGCASVDVIDTEHGPRFVESSCGGSRGDGKPSLLEQAHARADAERRASYEGGPPAGAMTRTRAEVSREVAPIPSHVDEDNSADGRLDRALARQAEERRASYEGGPPAGAMTRTRGDGIGRA